MAQVASASTEVAWATSSDPRQALEELAWRSAKAHYGSFFRAFPPAKPYVYGRHTLELMTLLDSVTKDVEQGISRYVVICMPPRHGKSDLVSRRYGVWHLLRNPDHEVILATYNFSLAADMSFKARELMRTIGPIYGLGVQSDRGSLDSWMVAGHRGAMHATGLGGTITGRGAHVAIIDDYLKNREEAESELIRNRVWSSFQSDLMTRLAPVHAVIVMANRWHEDDLIGRISNANNPTHDAYDPEFPQFEHHIFPSQNVTTGAWLFPERFSEQWYKTIRALMGTYAWNAQGLQDPQPKKGNLLRVDRVKIIESSHVPEGLIWRRGWDLASSEKQRIKDSPDYSVGTLVAYDGKHTPPRLVVRHVVRGQWTAPRRDEMIRTTGLVDGPAVTVRVEVVAGYKDCYEIAKKALLGIAIVRKTTPSVDKVARASVLEPVFEDGEVCIVRGGWNQPWLNEVGAFPNGTKDDQVDSLVTAIHDDILARGRMALSAA